MEESAVEQNGKKNKPVHKVALLGMLAAFALILGWVEHALPVVVALPGIKLGLGNVAVLLALYLYGTREALLLTVVKVALSALLFGSLTGLLYSAAGGLLSLAVMSVLKHTRKFTQTGVSAAGGCAHIVAQVAVAALLTSTPQVWYMLSPLMFAALVCGIITGICARLVVLRVSRYFATASTD